MANPNARKPTRNTIQVRVSDEVLVRIERQAELFGVTRAQYATWLVAQGAIGTDKVFETVAAGGGGDLMKMIETAIPTEGPEGADET